MYQIFYLSKDLRVFDIEKIYPRYRILLFLYPRIDERVLSSNLLSFRDLWAPFGGKNRLTLDAVRVTYTPTIRGSSRYIFAVSFRAVGRREKAIDSRSE